ncbi:MAG: dihydropteroate synthase [Saprospiraceae bacterium]|nr:dihydropteroate synthase [Saprospiraceae bacterium]
MGIINVNPDSFFQDSRKTDIKAILDTTERMLMDGADILDIGGMSSRPGAQLISEEEELRRTVSPITEIIKRFPEAIISVDTMRSRVASETTDAGAKCINDISAGNFDPKMFQSVAKSKVPLIMMHMKGLPSDMQDNPNYGDVVMDIMAFFKEKIVMARKEGIHDIIIDPGFGFGKTLEHNYTLMRQFEVFSIFDVPLLAGVSRKSMIWKKLDITPEQALNGTTALHMHLLGKGVHILRVHDVKEAKECIELYRMLEI